MQEEPSHIISIYVALSYKLIKLSVRRMFKKILYECAKYRPMPILISFFPWFFYNNNAFQSYMPLDNVACFLCFFVYDVTPFFNEMLWAIHMLTSPGYKNGTFILVWGPADCSMPYYMPTSLCYVRHSPKIIETPFVSWRQLKSCCHSIPLFGWQI